MTSFLRTLLLLVAATTPLLATAQRFTAEQIAEQVWIQGVALSGLTLSPDGRHLAGMGYGKGGPKVVLIDAETTDARVLVRRQPDGRYLYGQIPIDIHWIANDLLAVNYNNREAESLDLSGKVVAPLGERFIRRLADSGPLAESVLVYRDIDDGEIDVVHARTGVRRLYDVSLPGKPSAWVFDDGGELRAVSMVEEGGLGRTPKIGNWYRAGATQPWQLLQEWPMAAIDDAWMPLRLLPQPGMLAVWSRHDRDTRAVFRYDTTTRQHVEVMAAHPSEDILGVEGLQAQELQRVVTAGLLEQTYWFDARWAGLQAGVDAAIPGRVNRLSGDKNGRVLVHSFGDVDPGRWFVLDTRTAKLREIAAAMPEMKPEDLRPMQTLRYPARDGIVIPAYLTRPAGPQDQPAPMVVVIHGGPNVRDRWGFDDEVQMLAKAGYVVFQPQFRGSSGFGRRFEEAGFRQWGRSMQDDITDGVRHLVEQKIADPARVCIFGASYGGYAAMWATIKTPELFRCAISYAGVSDLTDMLSSGFWDDSTKATREIRQSRVGDPDKDRRALDEVSPLRHVARVGAPLLIAHGERDLRVLPSQSKSMVRALEQAGKPVEWLLLEDEGHGLSLIRARVKFYTAALNFLDRHLGKPADRAKP